MYGADFHPWPVKSSYIPLSVVTYHNITENNELTIYKACPVHHHRVCFLLLTINTYLIGEVTVLGPYSVCKYNESVTLTSYARIFLSVSFEHNR